MRAKETAEITKEILGVQEINFHQNLRERYFGGFDKTSLENIKKVWEQDRVDADHAHEGVESPNQVLERTLVLIDLLEKDYTDKKILLVSHGDVLQILHTYFSKKTPRDHREIPHIETAEVRELVIAE